MIWHKMLILPLYRSLSIYKKSGVFLEAVDLPLQLSDPLALLLIYPILFFLLPDDLQERLVAVHLVNLPVQLNVFRLVTLTLRFDECACHVQFGVEVGVVVIVLFGADCLLLIIKSLSS